MQCENPKSRKGSADGEGCRNRPRRDAVIRESNTAIRNQKIGLDWNCCEYRFYAALVSKLVPCAWILSGALEVLRLRLQSFSSKQQIYIGKLIYLQLDQSSTFRQPVDRTRPSGQGHDSYHKPVVLQSLLPLPD